MGATSDKMLMYFINRDDKIEMHMNTKVLGISWDYNKDTLNLGLCHIFEKAAGLTPAKRNILKSIASIYDPIIFLQNITINLKILLQEISLHNSGWDDIIENDLKEKWMEII